MANLVRSDPFTQLASSWQRDIEQTIRRIAETVGAPEGLTGRRADWLPTTDVLTRGDDLVVRMELAGIDPERDVEIAVDDGTLHVRGQRQETEEEKREGFVRRERLYGAFERTMRLPANVSAEDLKASYSDGILEIVVPGAAKRSSQRVRVDVARQKQKK